MSEQTPSYPPPTAQRNASEVDLTLEDTAENDPILTQTGPFPHPATPPSVSLLPPNIAPPLALPLPERAEDEYKLPAQPPPPPKTPPVIGNSRARMNSCCFCSDTGGCDGEGNRMCLCKKRNKPCTNCGPLEKHKCANLPQLYPAQRKRGASSAISVSSSAAPLLLRDVIHASPDRVRIRVRPATTDDEERKHPSDERDSEADVDSAAEAAAEQLRSLDLQHGELTDREKRRAEELKQMKVQLSKTIDKLNVAQRAVVKTGKELKESKATIDAL